MRRRSEIAMRRSLANSLEAALASLLQTYYSWVSYSSPQVRVRLVHLVAYLRGIEDFLLDEASRTKGIRWSYNRARFQLFWKNWDDAVIRAMYATEMYPIFIEVEVTTSCNLKCSMCEHTYWKEPTRNMSLDEFKSIVDQFPDLAWIGLTGIGESFLNKDFLSMVEYVKGRHVFVEIYDSFYFMDGPTIQRVIDLGVDRIIASIDAGTKETYESIRRGSSWEKVWANVVGLDRYKKRKGTGQYPELCFHYIVTKENSHEVIKYLRRLKELDIDVGFVQFARALHSFKEIKDKFMEVPEEVQAEILDEARRLGMRVCWNADLPRVKPPKTKCTEIFMPFFFVSGHVITCCAMNEQNDREWQKSVSLGNIFEKPFHELWYGDRYRRVRGQIAGGTGFPLECRDCPVYECAERAAV